MDQSDKRGPKKEKSKRKRTNERCPAQPVRKERSKGWCAKELASPQTAPEVRGRWTCAQLRDKFYSCVIISWPIARALLKLFAPLKMLRFKAHFPLLQKMFNLNIDRFCLNIANPETKLRQLSTSTCRSSDEHAQGSMVHKITHKKKPHLHVGWQFSKSSVTR